MDTLFPLKMKTFAKPSGNRAAVLALPMLSLGAVLAAEPAFAQDAAGDVYALTSITTGPVGSQDTIYKIVPAE